MLFPLVAASSLCYNDYCYPDEPWLTPEGIYIKPVDRSDMGYALSFDAYCSNHEIFPSIGFKANENQSDGGVAPEQRKEAIEAYFKEACKGVSK